MNRKIPILLATCWISAVAPAGAAQEPAAQPPAAAVATPEQRLEASPRHHEWVQVEVKEGRKVATWVVYPERAEPRPVVVLIHENRGLNDWLRALADAVAEAGYLALAPDLLSGAGANGGGTAAFESADAARTALYELAPEQVLQDLQAVVDYGRALESGSKKVVVAGFCWGGGKAFEFASRGHGAAAALVFYGSAPSSEEALQSITMPVYGFYGGNDRRITGAVPALEEQMKKLGKRFAAVVYDGANHAFLRRGEEQGASPEDQAARAAAWKRMLEVIEEVTKSAEPRSR